MRSRLLTCLSVILALTWVGCGGGSSSTSSTGPTSSTAALKSIVVAPGTFTLAEGSSQQYTATGTYSDGSTKDLTASATWSSSAVGIVTINASGLASTVAGGVAQGGSSQATIIAKSGSVSGQTPLTVTDSLVSIAVSPSTASVNVGSTTQFTATGTYQDKSTSDLTSKVTWTASTAPGGAAKVVAGLVTGLTGGTGTISAAQGSVMSAPNAALTVNGVLALILNPIGPGMVTGGQTTFTANAVFSGNSTPENVTAAATWASSNPSAITVSGAQASAVGPGVSTISATFYGQTGTTAVNVVSSAYATLNGDYVFTLTAADSRGPAYFYGAINASGSVINGTEDCNSQATGVRTSASINGTYLSYPDGRGEITFGANLCHPKGITLRFILAGTSGNSGRLVEFDAAGTAKGSIEQQTVPLPPLNASYVFHTAGIDSTDLGENPLGEVGLLNLAAPSVTGEFDYNDYGTVSASPVSFTAGSFVAPNSLGRGTMNLASPLWTAPRNYAFYEVNANKFYLIEIDLSPSLPAAVAGVAEQQTSGTYAAANLTGNYAFLVDRPVVVGSGSSTNEFGQVGEYTLTPGAGSCVSGSNCATGWRDDTSNVTNPVSIAGGYTVTAPGSDGRGTITANGADSGRTYVFYIADANASNVVTRAFLLQTYNSPKNNAGSLNAPTGEMDLQTAVSTSSFLSANYMLDASALAASSGSGFTGALMLLNLNAGNITGIADVSQSSNGTVYNVSSTVVSAATYLDADPVGDPTAGRGGINGLPSVIGANGDLILYLISPDSAWLIGPSANLDGGLNIQQ